jgi:hypothetical protein
MKIEAAIDPPSSVLRICATFRPSLALGVRSAESAFRRFCFPFKLGDETDLQPDLFNSQSVQF